MNHPGTDDPRPWLSEDSSAASSGAEPGFTPDDIAGMADRGVVQSVAYAFERSPFYREKFRAAGLSPADFSSADDLSKLPPTSKKELSQAGADLWCVPAERIVDIVTTSGTTGVPTLYPLTESDVRRLGYNEHLSFRCVGLTSRDIVLLAVTMDKCFMAGLAYFEGLRRTGAATVRVGSGSPVMLLSLIERLRPTAIVSVPSFLKKVAQYASESGIALAESTVDKLICIGEPIRALDGQPNALGGQISASWGARVYSTYGATEIASSLCECEAGAGGHLHPEITYLEILDEDDRPAPEGQAGEMVATTIGVEAMPVLRFRTGDCASLTRERCACGLWTPRIGPILGRKNQMMKLKGTTVYPAAVQRVLDAVDGVTEYVMIVSSATELSDELEVVVAAEGDGAPVCRTIRERLQGELKVTPSVRAAGLEEVAGLQSSRTLRKKRVFIDQRPNRSRPL